MKKFLRRLFKITLISLPFVALAGWFAVERVLPYSPIKPFRNTAETSAWRLPLGVHPEDYGLQAERFAVRTRDSLTLQAFFIPGRESGRRPTTIILLHGISGCKEHFLPTAQKMTARGLNVVLLDLRAHGESGGDYCTFGFYEKSDVSALVDTLLARDSTQRIGILGNSLGGAIALQALAADKRLQFGVIESTFHDLQAVVTEYGEDLFGIKSPWLARHILEKSAVIAHFDPFSIKPGEAARQIAQPVFMSHGDADEKIPFAFGRVNFEHLASVHKQWYTIAGGHHRQVAKAGGEAYFEAIMRFIDGCAEIEPDR